MKYRLAAGLLILCLIPANICQGAGRKGILDGDTMIEKRIKGSAKIKPKKERLKKTPKGKNCRKGIAKKKIKVENASLYVQVARKKGRDGIKEEVFENWEKEIMQTE